MKLYLLMSDLDGSMRSTEEVIGIVSTIEEAKRFVKEGNFGYSHSFKEFKVFDDKDLAIKYWDKKYLLE